MNYYYINDEHLKRVGSGNNTYDLAYNARDPCVTRTVNGAITYYIYDGRSRFWSTTQTARWSVSISMGKGIDEIIERGAYGADNQGGRRVTFKHLTLALTCYAKSMARPLRVEFEGAVYHLCARGNARQPVFRDERDCARFLELLTESAQRFEAAILCFVLMGNHFHLVAQTRRPNLRRWMHWLLVSYTMYFNRRHRSSGHLFQGRYKSFLVQEDDYLLGLSRYVHLNPVRGLGLGRGNPTERRKRLRGFKWSSYRGYAGLSATSVPRRGDGLGRATWAQARGAIALQALCRGRPVEGD